MNPGRIAPQVTCAGTIHAVEEIAAIASPIGQHRIELRTEALCAHPPHQHIRCAPRVHTHCVKVARSLKETALNNPGRRSCGKFWNHRAKHRVGLKGLCHIDQILQPIWLRNCVRVDERNVVTRGLFQSTIARHRNVMLWLHAIAHRNLAMYCKCRSNLTRRSLHIVIHNDDGVAERRHHALPHQTAQ